MSGKYQEGFRLEVWFLPSKHEALSLNYSSTKKKKKEEEEVKGDDWHWLCLCPLSSI
jgi:hypothetical protein